MQLHAGWPPVLPEGSTDLPCLGESPIVVSDRNLKRVVVTVHGFCDYYAQRTLARDDKLCVSTTRPRGLASPCKGLHHLL